MALADTASHGGLTSSVWRWTAPMRGALAAGAVAGLLVVGVGSRIAMRIIFLADRDTDGVLTSDQFTVGQITLEDTLNLFALGTFIGVFIAPLYLGLRRWIPVSKWLRGVGFGYGALGTGGMLLINEESVDFRIFEPVVLGIGLFAVLFILAGVVLSGLMDRFHPEPEYPLSTRAPRIAAGVLVFIAVLGTLVFAARTVSLIDKEGTCVAANLDFECIPARASD